MTEFDVYCACGCGALTPLAKRNDFRHGHVKGQPTRFRKGHAARRPAKEATQCQAPGCQKKARRPGTPHCAMHASRLLRHGSLEDPRSAPLDRFFRSVQQDGDCWLWTGQRTHGYGTFALKERKLRAHRYAYEQMRADIPAGLALDHLCSNRACVNPWHLEPVPQRINVLRGPSPIAKQAAQKSCKRGHEFTPDNTYTDPRGHRSCRICERAKQARRRERKRNAA